jgi:hypothetical protein
VTIDGESHPLSPLFPRTGYAEPVSTKGLSLPEAQLDRFL